MPMYNYAALSGLALYRATRLLGRRQEVEGPVRRHVWISEC